MTAILGSAFCWFPANKASIAVLPLQNVTNGCLNFLAREVLPANRVPKAGDSANAG